MPAKDKSMPYLPTSFFSLLLGTRLIAFIDIDILLISKLSLIHPFMIIPLHPFLNPSSAKLSPTNAHFSEPLPSTTITQP